MTTTSASSGKKTNAAANKSTKGGNSSGSNSNGNHGNVSSSKNPRIVELELTVAPCQWCIEARKICLQIQLFQQHMPWDTNQQYQHSQYRRGNENHRPNTTGQGNENELTVEGSDKNNAGNDKNNDDEHSHSLTPGVDGWNNNSLLSNVAIRFWSQHVEGWAMWCFTSNLPKIALIFVIA